MNPSDSQTMPLAGPSNAPPVVFQPPQPLPYPSQHLHSTRDLLAVFNLLPAYDKYVRPHVRPIDPSTSKGKEREVPPGDSAGPDRLAADEDEGGEKKKKKDSYRHLIKRTPGKHSTKKDSYFQTLMAVPPKQKLHVQPIDARTLREGFSVSLTGLPTYNKAALEGTDAKEKEAKRLKKERRKAEKERLRLQQEQAQGSVSSASTPAAASTPRAGATPGSSVLHVRNVTVGTPVTKNKPLIAARATSARPATPKPPTIGAQQQNVTFFSAVTQQSTTTSVAGVHPPHPGATATVNVSEKRGQKREPDGQPPTPGAIGSTDANGPRPQKKRRLSSSTPQPAPLQQPTPHGS